MVQDRHIPGLIKITINQLDIDVALAALPAPDPTHPQGEFHE